VSINQTTFVKILTQFLLEVLKITSSQSITNLNVIKGKNAITCGIKDEREVWLMSYTWQFVKENCSQQITSIVQSQNTCETNMQEYEFGCAK